MQASDRAVADAAKVLTDVYLTGARIAQRDIGAALGLVTKSEFAYGFDYSDEAAAEAAEQHAARLVTETDRGTQSAISRVIADAQRNGMAPDDQAKLIQDMIGLDRQAASKYNRLVEQSMRDGDSLAAARRRHASYAKKALARRSVTIARTETMRAANSGQMVAWRGAIDAGVIDPDMWRREWVTTYDERTCDICRPLDRQHAGVLDGVFSENVQTPPAHPRCRCTMTLARRRDSEDTSALQTVSSAVAPLGYYAAGALARRGATNFAQYGASRFAQDNLVEGWTRTVTRERRRSATRALNEMKLSRRAALIPRLANLANWHERFIGISEQGGVISRDILVIRELADDVRFVAERTSAVRSSRPPATLIDEVINVELRASEYTDVVRRSVPTSLRATDDVVTRAVQGVDIADDEDVGLTRVAIETVRASAPRRTYLVVDEDTLGESRSVTLPPTATRLERPAAAAGQRVITVDAPTARIDVLNFEEYGGLGMVEGDFLFDTDAGTLVHVGTRATPTIRAMPRTYIDGAERLEQVYAVTAPRSGRVQALQLALNIAPFERVIGTAGEIALSTAIGVASWLMNARKRGVLEQNVFDTRSGDGVTLLEAQDTFSGAVEIETAPGVFVLLDLPDDELPALSERLVAFRQLVARAYRESAGPRSTRPSFLDDTRNAFPRITADVSTLGQIITEHHSSATPFGRYPERNYVFLDVLDGDVARRDAAQVRRMRIWYDAIRANPEFANYAGSDSPLIRGLSHAPSLPEPGERFILTPEGFSQGLTTPIMGRSFTLYIPDGAPGLPINLLSGQFTSEREIVVAGVFEVVSKTSNKAVLRYVGQPVSSTSTEILDSVDASAISGLSPQELRDAFVDEDGRYTGTMVQSATAAEEIFSAFGVDAQLAGIDGAVAGEVLRAVLRARELVDIAEVIAEDQVRVGGAPAFAAYSPSLKRLRVSREMFNDPSNFFNALPDGYFTDKSVEAVIVHETGHAIYETLDQSKRDILAKVVDAVGRPRISRYAETNDDEYFAEAIAAAILATSTEDARLIGRSIIALATGAPLPDMPMWIWGTDTSQFDVVESGTGLGGMHDEKVLFRTPDGALWLYKAQLEYRAQADAVASTVYRAMGVFTPQAMVVNIPEWSRRFNTETGSVQRWIEPEKSSPRIPLRGMNAPGKTRDLTPQQGFMIQKLAVLEWLLSQNDGHDRNYAARGDGRGLPVVPIDLGQAFKFFGADTLSESYNPNPSTTMFHALVRDFVAGEDVPLYTSGTPEYFLLINFIKSVERFDDADFEQMIRPYAEALYSTRDTGASRGAVKRAYPTVDDFINAVIARKRNLRDDFKTFYEDVAARRSAPMPQLPSLPIASVDMSVQAEEKLYDYFVGGTVGSPSTAIGALQRGSQAASAPALPLISPFTPTTLPALSYIVSYTQKFKQTDLLINSVATLGPQLAVVKQYEQLATGTVLSDEQAMKKLKQLVFGFPSKTMLEAIAPIIHVTPDPLEIITAYTANKIGAAASTVVSDMEVPDLVRGIWANQEMSTGLIDTDQPEGPLLMQLVSGVISIDDMIALYVAVSGAPTSQTIEQTFHASLYNSLLSHGTSHPNPAIASLLKLLHIDGPSPSTDQMIAQQPDEFIYTLFSEPEHPAINEIKAYVRKQILDAYDPDTKLPLPEKMTRGLKMLISTTGMFDDLGKAIEVVKELGEDFEWDDLFAAMDDYTINTVMTNNAPPPLALFGAIHMIVNSQANSTKAKLASISDPFPPVSIGVVDAESMTYDEIVAQNPALANLEKIHIYAGTLKNVFTVLNSVEKALNLAYIVHAYNLDDGVTAFSFEEVIGNAGDLPVPASGSLPGMYRTQSGELSLLAEAIEFVTGTNKDTISQLVTGVIEPLDATTFLSVATQPTSPAEVDELVELVDEKFKPALKQLLMQELKTLKASGAQIITQAIVQGVQLDEISLDDNPFTIRDYVLNSHDMMGMFTVELDTQLDVIINTLKSGPLEMIDSIADLDMPIEISGAITETSTFDKAAAFQMYVNELTTDTKDALTEYAKQGVYTHAIIAQVMEQFTELTGIPVEPNMLPTMLGVPTTTITLTINTLFEALEEGLPMDFDNPVQGDFLNATKGYSLGAKIMDAMSQSTVKFDDMPSSFIINAITQHAVDGTHDAKLAPFPPLSKQALYDDTKLLMKAITVAEEYDPDATPDEFTSTMITSLYAAALKGTFDALYDAGVLNEDDVKGFMLQNVSWMNAPTQVAAIVNAAKAFDESIGAIDDIAAAAAAGVALSTGPTIESVTAGLESMPSWLLKAAVTSLVEDSLEVLLGDEGMKIAMSVFTSESQLISSVIEELPYFFQTPNVAVEKKYELIRAHDLMELIEAIGGTVDAAQLYDEYAHFAHIDLTLEQPLLPVIEHLLLNRYLSIVGPDDFVEVNINVALGASHISIPALMQNRIRDILLAKYPTPKSLIEASATAFELAADSYAAAAAFASVAEPAGMAISTEVKLAASLYEGDISFADMSHAQVSALINQGASFPNTLIDEALEAYFTANPMSARELVDASIVTYQTAVYVSKFIGPKRVRDAVKAAPSYLTSGGLTAVANDDVVKTILTMNDTTRAYIEAFGTTRLKAAITRYEKLTNTKTIDEIAQMTSQAALDALMVKIANTQSLTWLDLTGDTLPAGMLKLALRETDDYPAAAGAALFGTYYDSGSVVHLLANAGLTSAAKVQLGQALIDAIEPVDRSTVIMSLIAAQRLDVAVDYSPDTPGNAQLGFLAHALKYKKHSVIVPSWLSWYMELPLGSGLEPKQKAAVLNNIVLPGTHEQAMAQMQIVSMVVNNTIALSSPVPAMMADLADASVSDVTRNLMGHALNKDEWKTINAGLSELVDAADVLLADFTMTAEEAGYLGAVSHVFKLVAQPPSELALLAIAKWLAAPQQSPLSAHHIPGLGLAQFSAAIGFSGKLARGDFELINEMGPKLPGLMKSMPAPSTYELKFAMFQYGLTFLYPFDKVVTTGHSKYSTVVTEGVKALMNQVQQSVNFVVSTDSVHHVFEQTLDFVKPGKMFVPSLPLHNAADESELIAFVATAMQDYNVTAVPAPGALDAVANGDVPYTALHGAEADVKEILVDLFAMADDDQVLAVVTLPVQQPMLAPIYSALTSGILTADDVMKFVSIPDGAEAFDGSIYPLDETAADYYQLPSIDSWLTKGMVLAYHKEKLLEKVFGVTSQPEFPKTLTYMQLLGELLIYDTPFSKPELAGLITADTLTRYSDVENVELMKAKLIEILGEDNVVDTDDMAELVLAYAAPPPTPPMSDMEMWAWTITMAMKDLGWWHYVQVYFDTGDSDVLATLPSVLASDIIAFDLDFPAAGAKELMKRAYLVNEIVVSAEGMQDILEEAAVPFDAWPSLMIGALKFAVLDGFSPIPPAVYEMPLEEFFKNVATALHGKASAFGAEIDTFIVNHLHAEEWAGAEPYEPDFESGLIEQYFNEGDFGNGVQYEWQAVIDHYYTEWTDELPALIPDGWQERPRTIMGVQHAGVWVDENGVSWIIKDASVEEYGGWEGDELFHIDLRSRHGLYPFEHRVLPGDTIAIAFNENVVTGVDGDFEMENVYDIQVSLVLDAMFSDYDGHNNNYVQVDGRLYRIDFGFAGKTINDEWVAEFISITADYARFLKKILRGKLAPPKAIAERVTEITRHIVTEDEVIAAFSQSLLGVSDEPVDEFLRRYICSATRPALTVGQRMRLGITRDATLEEMRAAVGGCGKIVS